MSMDANTLLAAVFAKLNASSMLKGSSYLGSSGRIEKGPRRHKGLTAPCITMKIGGHSVDTESKVEDFTVYVNSFAKDTANGTPDLYRLAGVANVVELTLEDVDLSSYLVGFRFFCCYLISCHGEAFLDPDYPDEHYVTSAFRILCQSDMGIVQL